MPKRKKLGRKELKELAMASAQRRSQMENLRQQKAAQQRTASLGRVEAPSLDAAGMGGSGPPDPRAGKPLAGMSASQIQQIMLNHIKEKYPDAYKDAVAQGRKAAESAQRMQAQQEGQQQPMTGDIDAMMGQQQPGGMDARLSPARFRAGMPPSLLSQAGQQPPPQQPSPYPMMGGA